MFRHRVVSFLGVSGLFSRPLYNTPELVSYLADVGMAQDVWRRTDVVYHATTEKRDNSWQM